MTHVTTIHRLSLLPRVMAGLPPGKDRSPCYRKWRDWDPHDRPGRMRLNSREEIRHYDPQVRERKKQQRDARRRHYRLAG